ncbi:MAG: Uma2 family endonuclease [Chloroflexi bacterium]|nr:Uma2 family endonuclease [Chloroflexota bacterium]
MAVRRGVRFRADDIWDTPDDGDRYEVIDGRLYVSPPPILVHQNASGVLYFYLVQHVRQWRLGGKVYAAPVGVVLDDENGLQPDLVYISRERAGILAERGIEGAPDLVVEILSPSTRGRDRGIKMRRYAAAGVSYYWVVDPRTRTLEEYLLVEQGYELVGSHGPGSIFRPALFPGLEIPIDDLWA